MAQGSKTKALTLLLAVLLAGSAIGWVARGLLAPRQSTPSRSVDALVTLYTKKLHLDAAQADSVHAILERRQHETRAIFQEIHPRYDALRSRAMSDIEAQLRPDQKQRFEALIAAEDRERIARQRDRGLIDATPGQRQ